MHELGTKVIPFFKNLFVGKKTKLQGKYKPKKSRKKRPSVLIRFRSIFY
jgi:hypothetical protein